MHCSKNWVSQTYLYCSKLNLKCIFCTALLALCLCSCGNGKITVKTELTDGETVARVELSDGELFFKDREDVVSELTPQDFEDAKPKASEYHRNEHPIYYLNIEGMHSIEEDEAERLLNIYTEKWALPESCSELYGDSHFAPPSFYVHENGEYEYAGFYMFYYLYRNIKKNNAPVGTDEQKVNIRISPAPIKWSQVSQIGDYLFQNLISIRLTYGDLNSKIGDMPLAIIYEEINSPVTVSYIRYKAYFEAGNAAYEVLAQGVTQREFIDLLISIYASPRPETRNFFDVILPNAGD